MNAPQIRAGLERRAFERRRDSYEAALATHIRDRRIAERRKHYRKLADNWLVNNWLAVFHNRRSEHGRSN